MDIQLTLSAATLLHCLRHFDTVSPRLAARLRAEGATNDELTHAVAAAGSRFHPSLGDAFDVAAMLSTLAPQHREPQPDGAIAFTWRLDERSFPHGAGTCGVVALSELDDAERSRVRTEDRRGTQVRVVERARAIPTRLVAAIATRTSPPDGDSFDVRTFFPGPAAPPFPSDLPAGTWRDQAEAFWTTHVLVRVAVDAP